MLTSIRAIVVAISLFGTYASAQEASPVIAKALEAVGGKDKLFKIFRMDEVYHSGESAEVDSNTKRTKRTSIIELPAIGGLERKSVVSSRRSKMCEPGRWTSSSTPNRKSSPSAN